jgi:uncharacterized protein YndB with AHSA1/START domain
MKTVGLVAAMVLMQTAFGQTERAIEKSVVVPAPVTEVWKVWTTAEGLKSFMCQDASVELRLGGRYEILFSTEPPIGLQGSEGSKVLSYIPEKMLSFSWNAPPSFPDLRNMRTFVVLTFEAADGGTRVNLRHAGWRSDARQMEVFAYFDKAWDTVLGWLKERFEKGPRAIPPGKPQTKIDDEALTKLKIMVGGKWRGDVKDDHGKAMVVEFVYKNHPDGRGVVGEGVIGKGRKDAIYVRTQFGWDPIAKAVYYFDSHNSDTLYFGQVSMDGEDYIFTFGPLGGPPAVFGSRSRFKHKDTLISLIRDATGKEIVGLTLKRVK